MAAAGFALLFSGAALVVSVAAQSSASAQTLTGPYELFCPGTPVGNIALNDATTTGDISPASVNSGDTFNVTNYQTTVTLPAALASAAAAVSPGQPLTGSATGQLDVTGGAPATMTTGTLNFSVNIPSPVPESGLALAVPSSPTTIGPFTASSSAITIGEDSSTSLTLVVAGSPLTLTCTSFPNNAVTPSGITTAAEPTDPLTPVIAEQSGTTTTTEGPTTTEPATTSTSSEATTTTTTAGTTTTTTPGSGVTGAYELYCPGTPVGNIALNDAVTVGTITPASPSVGDTFNVTDYQTTVSLPQTLAAAAASVSPGQPLAGSAVGQLDVTGATPAALTTGTLNFSVNIPSPVPASGLALQVPATPGSLGPFTATGTQITMQEDSSTTLTLIVAGSPLTLTCKSFPNNSVTPTGITTTPEPTDPIMPVIALAAAAATTTTTPPPTTTTPPPTTTTPPPTTTTPPPTTTTPPATSTTVASSTTTAPGSTTTAASSTTVGPSSTHQTTATSTPPTAGSSGAQTVTASSHSLAFTGSGPGLQTTTLIGAALMLVGLVALFLVDVPRRLVRQFATLGPRKRMTHLVTKAGSLAKSTRDAAVRSVLWVLGR